MDRKMKTRLASISTRWAALVVSLLLLLSVLPNTAAPANGPGPDFSLEDLIGRTITLSSLRGRDAILLCGTTGCPQCDAALTLMDSLFESVGDELQILFIGVGQTTQELAAAFGSNVPSYGILPDHNRAVSSSYGIERIPTCVFVDQQGLIQYYGQPSEEVIWRFRAAPEDRRMTSFEQVESIWPVHGSALVKEGVVYCVAGRSMFLDGGLRYLRLDAETGRKLGETIFDERDPTTSENLQVHVRVRNMPVGLPDVLSTDGQFLYMRSQRFDFEGNRFDLALHSGNDAEQGAVQKGEGVHLFSPTGFLDGTWFHRSYWVNGRSFAEGAGGWPQAGKFAPAGRIMVLDDTTVYGFGREPMYYQWRTPLEYHLFASSRDPEIIREPIGPPIKGKPAQAGQPRRRMVQHPRCQWSRSVPLLVRAMVLAREILFMTGPPDVVDEEEAFRRVGDPEIQAQLASQDAAMAGEKGALLWAVSVRDAEKQAEYRLDSLPIFDGMAAAYGRLYIATLDGGITCLGGENPPK